MAFSDCILIFCVAIFTSSLSEFISYILVYRKEKYQKLNASMEKAAKKLAEMDKGTKKYEKEEAKIKDMSRELQSTKLGSMFAMMLVFGTIVSTVSSIYEGQSVAELPFEPIWFFKSFAQRGLINPKPNECSFIFIYILSTMSVRQPIQKFLGFAPSRAASKLSNAGMQPSSFTDVKNTYGSGAY